MKIDCTTGSLPTPRVSATERKAANAKLKELLKQTTELMTMQIDRLMVPFEEDKPEFYASYKSARIVIGYGTRYEKAEVPEPATQP